MRRVLILLAFVAALGRVSSAASYLYDDPPVILDTYRISFGPEMLAIPGDPDFQIPLRIHVTAPTVRINLVFSYDPTVLTPVLLAPNIFVQSFDYDLSQPGRIKLSVITDLSPPPYIPPILGDTIFGWISCRVTSRFIGYDYLTHVDYFEDPLTPYPDNYIVLENDNIITPPLLELLPGRVVVWFPLYGDINDNTYPWEIGDAVTFLNFFMGMTPFTRRQYANSDCNRDGVQASISDLVYLLRVISDDSVPAAPEIPGIGPMAGFFESEGTPSAAKMLLPFDRRYDLIVGDIGSLGGASFVIDLSGAATRPKAVMLDPLADGMQLYCSFVGDLLHITVLDWDGLASTFHGGRLLSIIFPGQADSVSVSSAEFSDNDGQAIAPAFRLDDALAGQDDSPEEKAEVSMSLSGYPNPFNGQVTVSYSLPAEGRYDISVYDLLGRKVKTLLEGQLPQGPGSVIWNAADDSFTPVASGTYFLRLQGDGGRSTTKLFLMK